MRALIIVMAAAQLAVAQQEKKGSIVFVKEGGAIHGSVVRFADKVLTWKSPAVRNLMEVLPASIAEINFQPTGGDAPGASLVHLTNGDRIRGDVVSFDADHLLLKTAFVGDIKIRMSMVQRIESGAGEQLFPDAMNLEKWRIPQANTWVAKNGLLEMIQYSGTLEKTFDELPEQVFFDFTMKMANSGSKKALISLFHDPNRQPMRITLQSNMIYISTRNINHQSYSQQASFVHDWKQEMRLRVCVDRKAHKTLVFVNDKEVLKLSRQMPLTHNAIQVTGYRGLQLSRVRVARWYAGTSGNDNQQEDDRLMLENGDRISGNVLALKEGVLSFGMELIQDLKIPFKRISSVSFGSKKQGRSRRFAGDVRADAGAHGLVTVRLDGISDGQVKGYSEHFGEVTFSLEALKQLKFNLYAE